MSVFTPQDDLAKRFKSLTLKHGILKEIKTRQSFTKKSQRKRLKSLAARKKLRKIFTKEGEHKGLLAADANRYGRD